MPVRSISKAQLAPSTSTIYYCLQTYPHFPPRDTTITLSIFFKKIEDGRRLAVVSSSTTPGPPWGLWANSAGPGKFCHFACHSPSVSFVSSSHVDVQVFAPSTTVAMSWTRDCRSFLDLIKGEMLLRVCNATISLLQTSFGCFKPGVTRMSGMFCVRRSWSICWKAAIPRWPLRRETTTNKKVNKFEFRSVIVGGTYSPIFWWWSFFELQPFFESLKCIARR